MIAQYALSQWNEYVITGDDAYRGAFLTLANWLVEHEVRIGIDAGGWPISSSSTNGIYLSALIQGCALSVLVRAYQLTHDEAFMTTACHAVRTFELDILDGGVNTPVNTFAGNDGIFFEEIGIYPASHSLIGCLFGLLGLHDYQSLTADKHVAVLLQRAQKTLQYLLHEFDVGYWTYTDLLHRHLAPPSHFAQQITLLEVLADVSNCEQYVQITRRWQSYRRNRVCRLRSSITMIYSSYSHKILNHIRATLFHKNAIHHMVGNGNPCIVGASPCGCPGVCTHGCPGTCTHGCSGTCTHGCSGVCIHGHSGIGTYGCLGIGASAFEMLAPHEAATGIGTHGCLGIGAHKYPNSYNHPYTTQKPLRVCIPVNAFPVLGGIRTVLFAMAQVTQDIWQTEYLTRYIGPDAEGYTIHRFGSEARSPWHVHTVWFYVIDGCFKLFSLLRGGANYHVMFPQDGVYTAAFTGIVAKLAGIRVVCIDHAYLTMLNNPSYQQERRSTLLNKPLFIRLLGQVLYALYWPSMNALAWLAARCVDAYFIPGIPGDGVEEVCCKLGIPASRITRFNSMINIEEHPILDASARTTLRKEKGLAEDDLVVAIICRLALEKGLDVAIAGIAQALFMLPPEVQKRVRIVIAGDGPLRDQVAEAIEQHDLQQTCLLWGNIPSDEVHDLLAISDIFLNTTVRGTCFPMSILEAMAAGCAVIASTQPISNIQLLEEGRGIAVASGNIGETAQALVQLLTDAELRHKMGHMARQYIATQHSPAQFRRSLQRITSWFELDTLLQEE